MTATLQPVRKFYSLKTHPEPAATPADPAASSQNLFLTGANLTFSGVTVVANFILNAVASNTGTGRAIAAGVIALVFGALLTYLGLSDPNRAKGGPAVAAALFLGEINTLLLGLSIYGVASIGDGGDPDALARALSWAGTHG